MSVVVYKFLCLCDVSINNLEQSCILKFLQSSLFKPRIAGLLHLHSLFSPHRDLINIWWEPEGDPVLTLHTDNINLSESAVSCFADNVGFSD